MNYQEIFNRASFAAIQCNKNRVKSNQISQLLSIFNTNLKGEPDNIIMLLMAFVMKQRERGYFGNESSNTINDTLKKIMEDPRSENAEEKKIMKKSNLREYLGLLKWFFEVADNIRVDWNSPQKNAFNSIVASFQNATLGKK